VCCSYFSFQCWLLNSLINGMDIAK
jgi:hypothetical protein